MRRFLESPVNIMVDKRVCEKIKFLEEENRKLKLHIEAKDKAYLSLSKAYE
jgi:hypothetical protein